MTNNNWIEMYKKRFGLCSNDGDCACKLEIKFISKLLNKKDQEHKAELEEIMGEIESKKAEKNTEFDTLQYYNTGIDTSVSILDKHINK